MERWHRVFGTSADPPDADPGGWVRGDLTFANGMGIFLDRYDAEEDGIRQELNSWAAWVETRGDDAAHVRLMERIIQTKQLIVFCVGDEGIAVGERLCRLIAASTGGIYQIDGRGLFDAEGALLLAED